MNPFLELERNLPEMEKNLGYAFKDKKLFLKAFIHRSFLHENKKIAEESNERLEFLGDAILGVLISDYLFHKFPDWSEGKLSSQKSFLVDSASCSHYMRKLGLENFILLGKGEFYTVSRGRDSIIADAFEALMGAIYLDGGFLAVKTLLLEMLQEELENLIKNPMRNYKAELQDYSQKKIQKIPEYKVLQESGPEHEKTFFVEVFLGDEKVGFGKGASKKEAEQSAAADALEKMQKQENI
jgi:ribonuclease-3